MKEIIFNLFPNGKKKAVTFSYDDGDKRDIRLTELFEKYGAKCTFNLNSAWINNPEKNRIDKRFVRYLSENHEVALHGCYHNPLDRIPQSMFMSELFEDKKALEEIIEKPIIGMAYANGSYTEEAINALDALGIKYARTVGDTRGSSVPARFLSWNPTCHHNQALNLVDGFLNNQYPRLPLFYVWGHSHELKVEEDWEKIETLLKKISERDDVWQATNGEIYDYITAIRNLRVTASCDIVFNPSAITVYATVDGKTVSFPSGLTKL